MSCFLYAKHIIIHLKARYNIMKIREFCKMKKITQEKLAEDLNVDVRTIRRWESSTPSTRIILKLANYFEVFPYNLLEENEKMPEFPIGQSGSKSSPNLCVNSSFSYVVLSTLLLSSRDLTEWSLVYHSTLSYQRFYDLHSIHYDHLEGLHQLI